MNLLRASGLAAFGLTALGYSGIALADSSMTINYFTLSETDADVGPSQCCSSPTNMVTNTLGPDGLPVYVSGSTSPAVHDLNGNGEITWWSPSMNANVIATGTGTVALPFSNNAMYAPNGTGSNDQSFFLTAVLTGNFTLASASTVTFNLASDDDAFVYVNNSLVGQNGGVHPTQGGSFADSLGPGTYSLTVFYADRDQTGAALQFSVDGATVNAVPEPSTWALMVAGVAFLGAFASRHRKAFAMPRLAA